MVRILFVCHGNICRSPMAEFILKEMVKAAGLAKAFRIASAATSDEELGNGVYPPVRALLERRGISCQGKTARRLCRADYDRFDCLIGMDAANRRNMLRLFGGDPQGKISLLLDWTGHPRDVADPWYTRDFRAAEADIEAGCAAILRKFSEPKQNG